MTAPRPRVILLSQQVHPIPPLKGAAVEQWIDSVARRLERYEPHVISVPHPERPDEETEGGVHFHRIRIGRLYTRLFRKLTRLDPYSYTDRILRYARSISPLIVHIHNAPQFVDSLVAGLPGSSIVLHMHNEKSDPIQQTPDVLVGCSNYIRDWYRTRGVSTRQYVTLPNGVDSGRFGLPTQEQIAEARRRFDVPGDKKIVLFVGRVSPEKGPILLARAAQMLPDPKFHFVFVGEWPKGDPRKSERVRYFLQFQREIENIPHTLIDSVPPGQMDVIYRLGDVLVIPSHFEEPFSMVAIEAMASGIPVIALRKGGMTEYMVDRENAILLAPDISEAGMAAAIHDAFGDATRLAGMVGRARKLVTSRFDWESVARQTEELYDQLLSGRAVR